MLRFFFAPYHSTFGLFMAICSGAAMAAELWALMVLFLILGAVVDTIAQFCFARPTTGEDHDK